MTTASGSVRYYDAERRRRIVDAQLMAAGPDGRHRPGVRQAQRFAALQQPEQVAGLDPGFFGKRRRLHFAAEPDDRPLGLWLLHRLPSSSLYVKHDIMSIATTS